MAAARLWPGTSALNEPLARKPAKDLEKRGDAIGVKRVAVFRAVVSQMHRSLRKGKICVDSSQNDDKKTTVWVYP